ncbi:MAG: PP2C family protein-serine/threonine phosphatase [Terracidiphilus sp.]
MMRLLMWAALCLAACSSTAGARAESATAAAPVVELHNPGSLAAGLSGPWQFHLGDDAAWARPEIDDSTGHDGWEQITADAPWGRQGHRSYTGYAWYRIHLSIAPGPIARGPKGDTDYTLLAPRLESTAEFYWNGKLVALSGKMPPYPSWTYDDPDVEGDEAPQMLHLGPMSDGVMAVRVWFRPLWSYDDGLQGGFYKTPLLGHPATIAAYETGIKYRQLRGDQYAYALYTGYALLMIVGFAGWLRDRSQRAMLWMAVFCLGDFGLALLGFLQHWITFQTGYFWEQVFLGVRDVGLWFLLLWLLDLHENKRLVRWTSVVAWIDLLAGVLDGVLASLDMGNPAVAKPAQIADAVLTVPLVGLSLYSLVLVGFALRKRLHGSRWAVAIFAFLAGALADAVILLQQGRRFTHWTVSTTISQPLFTIAGNEFNAQTLASTGLFLSILYAVYSYVVENSRQQSALAEEMRNARAVQQALIPEEVPPTPGFRIESTYKPAGEVGGDFFQVLPRQNGDVVVVIGDVSGKGMPAAMTGSLLVGTVRTLAQYMDRPSEILAAMNRRMLSRSRGGFTTCLVLRAEANGTVTAANAGHLSPYHNGNEVAMVNGLPLGISEEAEYPETTLQLAPGDALLLMSDGVVEARNARGELFGFERAQAIARETAEKVAETAEAFGQDDDITVVTVEREPVTVKQERPVLSARA